MPQIGEHLVLEAGGVAEAASVVNLFHSARQRSK
jgi:hypothetical protein